MGLMESIMKMFWGGEDESIVDPATGLSLRDKRLLFESWQILGSRKTQKKRGVNLFLQLFQTYPYQKDFFPLFKDKSLDELKTSSPMRAHAATLMCQMGAFVDSLEDTDCLVGLVEKLARNHKKRGIGYEQFEELRQMFGSFLDDELDNQATSELKEAWDHLLTLLSKVIKDIGEEE